VRFARLIGMDIRIAKKRPENAGEDVSGQSPKDRLLDRPLYGPAACSESGERTARGSGAPHFFCPGKNER